MESAPQRRSKQRTRMPINAESVQGCSPNVRYKKPPGQVYFIRSGRAIKIGWTLNMPSRFSNLQGNNPYPMELLGTVRGTEEDEREHHRLFVHLHLRGEWFHEDPAILEYIAATPRQQYMIRRRGSARLTTARLRSRSGLSEWRPIDTHDPKTCGDSSVLVVDRGVVSEAYFDGKIGLWWLANTAEHDFDYSKAIYPTHWMPMPEPPVLP